VGTTSVAQPVTLENNLNRVLDILGISVGPEFAQTNDCGSSLPAGASCVIHVTFSPAAAGDRRDVVAIMDDTLASHTQQPRHIPSEPHEYLYCWGE
jgi:hypothetical protein